MAATTPLGHRTAPLATTPTKLTSERSVLTPLLGQSQHVAPHGLPVRKGPLCSCWLLSVIYPSCCCSKDQSIPLPEACSKKASHLQHARLQADQLAKPPPLQSAVPRVGSAPGCQAMYSRCLHLLDGPSQSTASDSCRQIHVRWSATRDRCQFSSVRIAEQSLNGVSCGQQSDID